MNNIDVAKTRSEPGLPWLGRASRARQRSRPGRSGIHRPPRSAPRHSHRPGLRPARRRPGPQAVIQPSTRTGEPPLRPRRDQRNMEVWGGPSLPPSAHAAVLRFLPSPTRTIADGQPPRRQLPRTEPHHRLQRVLAEKNTDIFRGTRRAGPAGPGRLQPPLFPSSWARRTRRCLPPFPGASRLVGRRPRAEETGRGTRGSPQAPPAQLTLPLPPRAESPPPRVASCPRPPTGTFPVSAPSPPAPAHPHSSAAATSTGSGPGRAAPPRLAAGGGGGGGGGED
uniref:translation initiation factor IF-2-like n=1 Tax=Agelaius phoeniceus TaxID=39638 RepID=UPI0023EBFFC4|nr:translation initiation factor IF-2-like [Agelaius phoeniceus]